MFRQFVDPPVDRSMPCSSAGGIRTHGLELMRLVRTAAPLPRKSGRQESNLRSPAPQAGGVATLPYSQKASRQGPPAGLEPAASGLRARRHRHFDHGGTRAPAAGLEPAPSRVTVARRTSSTTPERKAEGEGVEPSRPGRPTRFRDGIPRRWQSFRALPVELQGIDLPGGSNLGAGAQASRAPARQSRNAT